jgi:hypothetical protein
MGGIEMGIKQALTRVLMDWLPSDDQARMAADLITWLFADLPAVERQEKIKRLGPRLIEMMGEGRFGLQLIIYYHLLRLPPFRWLERWAMSADASPEGQLARLACPRPRAGHSGRFFPRADG